MNNCIKYNANYTQSQSYPNFYNLSPIDPLVKKLVMRHNSDNYFSSVAYLDKIPNIRIFEGCIEITDPRQNRPPIEPPKRYEKDIVYFSKHSRLRLLKLLSTVHLNSYAAVCFVTLTYHNVIPNTTEQLKYHLNCFTKYLKRQKIEFDYIYRVELQRRNVPHFHFILFFKSFSYSKRIELFRLLLVKIWNKITKEENTWKDIHGVDCKLLNSYKQIFSYVSKYAAKTEEKKKSFYLGRRWGYSRTLICAPINEFKTNFKFIDIFKKNLIFYLKNKNRCSDDLEFALLSSRCISIFLDKDEFQFIFNLSLTEYYKFSNIPFNST